MANKEHITQGMQQTQNAIEFINKSVLKPDVKPMKGTAAPMIDQATGMMVQDLQSFLKGFEQVGLVALARLANNILTYGTYFGPKPSDSNDISPNMNVSASTKASPQNPENIGSDAMKGLFSVVGEYGKMKAEISSLIHSKHPKNDNPTSEFQPTTTTTSQPIVTPPPVQHTPTQHTTQQQTTQDISPAAAATAPVTSVAQQEDLKKENPPTDTNRTTVPASAPTEEASQPKNEAREHFINSQLEDIFEPLLETSEALTEELSETESTFEQVLEDEMNDHDMDDENNDDDDDDLNTGKKTYWFPKKK